MSKGKIGIKVADGSFYPVLEEDYQGQKKLVVTTVRDNQETVQIDLYQGESERAEESAYVGTLVIENIEPSPKREPEIEVVLGVDDTGNLNAAASDLTPLSDETMAAVRDIYDTLIRPYVHQRW